MPMRLGQIIMIYSRRNPHTRLPRPTSDLRQDRDKLDEDSSMLRHTDVMRRSPLLGFTCWIARLTREDI